MELELIRTYFPDGTNGEFLSKGKAGIATKHKVVTDMRQAFHNEFFLFDGL